MAPERGSGMFCAIGRGPGGLVDACQVCCQNCFYETVQCLE